MNSSLTHSKSWYAVAAIAIACGIAMTAGARPAHADTNDQAMYANDTSANPNTVSVKVVQISMPADLVKSFLHKMMGAHTMGNSNMWNDNDNDDDNNGWNWNNGSNGQGWNGNFGNNNWNNSMPNSSQSSSNPQWGSYMPSYGNNGCNNTCGNSGV